MRNYKNWFWTAVVLQFLTAAIHALSFLREPQPHNESEKMLIDLMQNYRQNLSGSMVSMDELLTALSACFSLVYLLGALVNGWLLRRSANETVLGGILTINLIIFGGAFVIMAVYTFPPPIILTGLVFLFLLVSAVLRRLQGQ